MRLPLQRPLHRAAQPRQCTPLRGTRLPDDGGLRPGNGVLHVAKVEGRSVVTRAAATNPLKLLVPRLRGPAAWAYTSTFGGGLVSGDAIDLKVRVGPGATCAIGTQASTKVYRSLTALPSRQSLHATVDEDATLLVLPDPLTCFAAARYEQSMQFSCSPDATLVLVDWLTSGRRARGECWALARYRSRIDVAVGGNPVLADALLLDPADGPLGGPYRLGRFHCLALVVLLGKRADAAAASIERTINNQPIKRDSHLIEAASPLRGGVMLRVLGTSTELIARSLKHRLGFARELTGEDPWQRKW
jgi:urease accessory protein